MAEAFKNAYLDVTNSAQTIYTAPGSTESVVITLRVTNVDGSTDDTITADVIDASSGNSRIASTLTVPADTSIELAGTSKIILEAGDKIDLTGGNTSGDLEAFLGVVEIT
tara:strand:- start:1076 stop:1405 length:330 start_codon:yes stop_codon:yes gene_type:complete